MNKYFFSKPLLTQVTNVFDFEMQRIKSVGKKCIITNLFGQPNLDAKGETFMRIEFDSYESTKTNPNAQGKSYNIYRVKGKALSGKLAGQEWQTQFFASAKEMASQVKALSKGDVIDVKMTQNGNYWNPQAFVKVEGEAAPLTAVVGATQKPVVVVDPKTENLKLAVQILGPLKQGQAALDYILEAEKLVNLIKDFSDNSGPFQFDKESMNSGIPEVEDDE